MKTWPTLLSADEARATFNRHFQPVPSTEEAATEAAAGRILAEEIRSPEDLPAFRRSLMDGYAVRAADVGPPPTRLRLLPGARMGEPSGQALGFQEAVPIPTGGMLPEDADAVIPVEWAERSQDWLTVDRAIEPGRHVIAAGADVRAGDRVLPKGRRLRPADLGALLSLGITRVPVFRRPQVGLMATGDELVPPEADPGPAQIRESNSFALAAAVAGLSAIPRRYPAAADREPALLVAARAALAENDMLILNGGSSVGERDLVAATIGHLGSPGVVVHGVNIRPGKPTIFGVCDGKPVFGLPGQPVSALNTFALFVAPVLRAWQQLPEPELWAVARLSATVRSADGREDHVRVALDLRDAGHGPELWADPIEGVSAMITTLVRADGILTIPAGSEGIVEDEKVRVRLLDGVSPGRGWGLQVG